MKFSQVLRQIGLAAVCVIGFGMVTGCASNFVRPANGALTLGKSTVGDIEKLAGKPSFQNDKLVLNGEKVKNMTYYYNDGAKFFGLIIPQRTLTYTLFNDTMVGEEFNSTMEGEETKFDTDKAVAIQKGKSTGDDVITLLGKPSGRVIYPIVKDKESSGFVYAYSYARFAGILTSYNNYLLLVTLNAQNIVTDVSYKKDGVEQIKD